MRGTLVLALFFLVAGSSTAQGVDFYPEWRPATSISGTYKCPLEGVTRTRTFHVDAANFKIVDMLSDTEPRDIQSADGKILRLDKGWKVRLQSKAFWIDFQKDGTVSYLSHMYVEESKTCTKLSE